MNAAKILVVDDELSIRTLVRRTLEQEGHRVETAENGEKALRLFESFVPELVVLDVMLPDIKGYELCRRLRSQSNVYILMLTACDEESDKIQGFTKGADDYLTKPFSVKELAFRVSAILKRQRTVGGTGGVVLRYPHIQLDPVRREVHIGRDPVDLTALEFDLLYLLARDPGRVWRRGDLIREVWGYSYVGDERVVDVHIGQIRKKLGNDAADEPLFVKTVRGVGYKFEDIGAQESQFAS